MLDIKFIVENPDKVKESIKNRNVTADVDKVINLYQNTKKLKLEIEEKRATSNQIAKKFPTATLDEKQALVKEGENLKAQINALNEKFIEVENELNQELLTIPNLLSSDSPVGNTDEDNVITKKVGTPRQFSFKPKDHLELGKDLDLIDFEGGAKVAGAKFYFLKNELVLLEMALSQFAIKKAIQNGYKPLLTPDLARNKILQGSGFAPRGNESNTYRIEDTDLSLIATAEIAVGGLHSEEILKEDDLPLKYAAISHCFRTEAGAGGKESKGLYRVHQFTKVELYQFRRPSESEQALEEMLALEEEIYSDLEIPYQVVKVCSGDLGAPAYKKYDIEAWMPGKGESGGYGEVTSASNCTDFQSRRLGIRFKDSSTGNNTFVHTLNGTAMALSRTLISVMENHQTADGGIEIPKVLRPFMGMDKIEPKK